MARRRLRLILLPMILAAVVSGREADAARPSSGELFSAADDPGVPGHGSVPAVRRRFVRANRELIDSGQPLRLNLFPDTQLDAAGAVIADRGNGIRSWSAGIEGTPYDRALLVVHGDGVTGLVTDGDAVYEILPVAGGVQEIRQIDRSAFPSEAEAGPAAATGRRREAASLAQAATGTVAYDAVDAIRVLIVYTPAAAGASADIDAAAQLAVDAANDAYANSNMSTRIELVAAAETGYVESGTIATDLSRLQGKNDGFMDEVHALRNAYLADFVSLLSNDGAGYCGMAKLMSMLSPSFESSAFSVVWLPCSASNWTTAHELGHNMGCQHDRANATSSPVLTYAYGFRDPAGAFRTVMGVADGCPGACPRIPHFANPDVTYSGAPTGISLAEPDAEACALAIDATSPVTTNFRTLVAPAGLSATTTSTDRVVLSFSHPWPWSFRIYRAETGQPMAPLETVSTIPYSDTSAVAGTSYDYWISAVTALDEESEIVGPVTGIRAIPVCGNNVTESPAEQCDDGGQTSGDGCNASCQGETPLDSEDGLCITTINNRTGRVAKAQGKENLACVAGASTAEEDDADGCLVADEKGKVGRMHEKAIEADLRFCAVPPPFGYAGGSVAADAAEDQRRASLHDLFGADVSAAVVLQAMDPDGADCQRAVAKSADRLLSSYLASFARCVKDRADDGQAYATDSLEACFDVVAADLLVTSSHITMDVTRLAQARGKTCSGLDLSALFPGSCASFTGTEFDSCVAASAACRTCLLFDAADALERDCDLFDNGAADSSCLP